MSAISEDVKLRVLILSKDLSAPGGVANFVKMLMENFDSNIEAEHFQIGSSSSWKTEKLYGSYLAIRASYRLIRKVKQARYDCIHLNPTLNIRSTLRDGMFLLVLSVFGFRKTILFFRGWDESFEYSIRKNKFFRVLFRKFFTLVPMTLVLGERFKESLINMGVPSEKIRVFTNFFDGNVFEGIRREVNSDKKKLLFFSRLVKEKGVFETLEAFRMLISEFPEITLVFAGDGPDLGILQNKVKEYGLENKVEFLGYVRGDKKGKLLINSDIFVLPTYTEGCPRSLLEAMAAGLPVVTCPVGGIPDIFKDGENGIFLSEISPEMIAHAIRHLLEEPGLCIRIGENNKRYAWENLELRSGIKKLEKVYFEVAEKAAEI